MTPQTQDLMDKERTTGKPCRLAPSRITERHRRERVASASPKIKASYLPAGEPRDIAMGYNGEKKTVFKCRLLNYRTKTGVIEKERIFSYIFLDSLFLFFFNWYHYFSRNLQITERFCMSFKEKPLYM